MSFDESLQAGRLGEGMIARWWQTRGWNVLPAYEVEVDSGKGPRLFCATREQLITPDMLIFKGTRVYWVEAKTKSAFTWHRLTSTWQTGIDRRHWRDYLRVADETAFPVWLMFLHSPGDQAKDTPEGLISPSGLYAQEIHRLQKSVDHEHDAHGPSGMVYWREDTLKRVCSYEEAALALAEAAR